MHSKSVAIHLRAVFATGADENVLLPDGVGELRCLFGLLILLSIVLLDVLVLLLVFWHSVLVISYEISSLVTMRFARIELHRDISMSISASRVAQLLRPSS